jgi:hypothetical protein
MDINVTYESAKEQLVILQKVGKLLLDSEFDNQNPLYSLWPLGMALLEGFNLFSILLFKSHKEIDNLFDGGQDKGPNIYTRLKFIRDLFSACGYATYYTRTSLTKPDLKVNLPDVSVEGINWLEIINPHVEQHEENILTEVFRLINETMEALLCIGLMLNVSKLNLLSTEIWQETNRHTEHIRDHFDYAETYLLDVLRPATE